MSIALKNNNPGNLRYAGQQGATNDPSGFAKFDTPQSGYGALLNDVQSKVTGTSTTGLKPDNTLEDFAKVYAPPNENRTGEYVANLANHLGVAPNTKLSELQKRVPDLANAISKNEDNEFYNKHIGTTDPSIPSQTQSNNNQIVTPQNNPLTSAQSQQNPQPVENKGLLKNIWGGLINATAGATENTGRNIASYGGAGVAKSLDALAGIVTGKGAGGITGKSYQDYVNQIAGNDNQGNITDSITQRLGGDNQRLATTPEQFAGDLIQTATLAVPGAETKGLSGLAKAKQLAKTGAIIGGVQGAGNAMSQNGSLGDIASQGAFGTIAGGILGSATSPFIKNAPKTAGDIEKSLTNYLGDIENKTSSAISLKNVTGDLNSNSYLYGGKNSYKNIQDFAIKESLDNGIPLFQPEDLGNGRIGLNTSDSIDFFETQIKNAKKLADDIVEKNRVSGSEVPYVDAMTGKLVKPNNVPIDELKTEMIEEASKQKVDPITKKEILSHIDTEFAKIQDAYGDTALSSTDINDLKNRMWETYRDNPTSASQKANKLMGQFFKTKTEGLIKDVKLNELNKQTMRYNDVITYLEKLGKVKLGNNLGSQTNKLIKDYVAGKFVKGAVNLFTGGAGGDLIEGVANLGMNKIQNRAAVKASSFPLNEGELATAKGQFTNPETIKARGLLNQKFSNQSSRSKNAVSSIMNKGNISEIIPQSSKIVKGLLKRGVNNSIINKTVNTVSPIK